MAPPKGFKKPPNSGRKKGVPNKITRELKEIFKEILEDPVGLAKIREQYQEGKIPPAVWCRMVDQVIGKPKEPAENLIRDVRVMFGGRYKEGE